MGNTLCHLQFFVMRITISGPGFTTSVKGGERAALWIHFAMPIHKACLVVFQTVTQTQDWTMSVTDTSNFLFSWHANKTGCYQSIMSSIGGGEVLPGFHLLLSSVTMSTPLIRFSQNSSRLLDSGKRPEIPAMTISSMLNCCEKKCKSQLVL